MVEAANATTCCDQQQSWPVFGLEPRGARCTRHPMCIKLVHSFVVCCTLHGALDLDNVKAE